MSKRVKIGVLLAVLAYSLWGILPLYWKLIDNIPSSEILAHRIFWAFIFVCGLLLRNSEWKEAIKACRDKKNLVLITFAAITVTINWGTYIWSVNSNHVVEASLGYYIVPLISTFFGVALLKEKLAKMQIISIVLAAIGVVIMTVEYGRVPWISLILAVSFALYGLLKKLTNVGSIISLGIETTIIVPLTLIYITFRQVNGIGALGNITTAETLLLIGSGAVTAVPLLLFGEAAKRIPLTTLGFTQYISPTISLILGVFLFKEEFTMANLLSFGFIWISLVIYSIYQTRYSNKVEDEKSDAVTINS